MSFNLRPLCYWSFWAKPIQASTVPKSSGLTSPTSVTSPKATIVSTIYSRQINFFQENLHFLVCEFGWWKQQPAQQIDIFKVSECLFSSILKSIKVNFSELLSASPVTSPASPVLTYSTTLTSVSEQTLWTGSFVLRIFLKTKQQKGSWL